jgi:hypothetical protein
MVYHRSVAHRQPGRLSFETLTSPPGRDILLFVRGRLIVNPSPAISGQAQNGILLVFGIDQQEG